MNFLSFCFTYKKNIEIGGIIMRKEILPFWIFWIMMFIAKDFLLDVFLLDTERRMVNLLLMAVIQSIPCLLYSILAKKLLLAIIIYIIVDIILMIIFLPEILIFEGVNKINHMIVFVTAVGYQTIAIIAAKKN